MHPLLDSDPAQRTPARDETPAAEAIAWLTDPQTAPPPMDKQEWVLRELAEAIGMPFEHMQEAVQELHETDRRNVSAWYAVDPAPYSSPVCRTKS